MKHIAITGPESTGKTTLASQLAYDFCSIWVPEYARTYFESKSDFDYDENDILSIFESQLTSMEFAASSPTDFIFYDTDMLVLKVWYEDKFGYIHPEIETAWQEQNMDLYILCDIDVKWEEDPLRENPHDRKRLMAVYEMYLKQYKRKYILLSGDEEKRVKTMTNYLMPFSNL